MNRSMDKIRILQGSLLLSNVLIIFLPMVSIWQENYPEQVYSQCSLIQGYLISGTGVGASPASGFTRFMAFLLVVLPLILAVFAGVCSLLERFYGKYVRIAGLAVFCLYLCQLLFSSITVWPRRLNEAQEYNREIGTWLLMAVVFGLLTMYVIPLFLPLKKTQKQEILVTDPYSPAQAAEPLVQPPVEMPSVHRDPVSSSSNGDGVSYTQTDVMRQKGHSTERHTLTQTQTELNLPLEHMDVKAEPDSGKADTTVPSRGVMVGVAGVFAGKEIRFQDQETLRLGRDLTNDLVFTNASHISRNHCQITWYAQKQQYYVEDRSSNGCFINGAAVRLPKNVEIALEPGTVIDIGDRTNRFRLE
ncbi:MAG: FHA domain-containing protein [Lachnospiraceae bacterium]|nr:FHA domain-containing protein [Lachnospiraceae bacterium]